MRAGDAERDAAIERLTASLGERRLDVDEYDNRLKKVMDATTTDELDSVVADLPVPRDQVQRLAQQKTVERHRKLRREWTQWFGGAILLTAIWGVISVATGELQHFWPAIPIGIWGALIIAEMIWPSKKKEG